MSLGWQDLGDNRSRALYSRSFRGPRICGPAKTQPPAPGAFSWPACSGGSADVVFSRSLIAAGYRSEMRTFWQQTFASSCRIAFGRSAAIRWRHARTGFLRKADVGSSDVPNFRPRESESVEKGHRKQEEFGKSYRGSKSVQDSLRLRNRPLPKACLTVKAGEHCDQKRNTSAHHCGEGNWSGHHDPLRSQLERRPPGLNKA
jgi:hypothetical protein